jgi:hypothetical protein
MTPVPQTSPPTPDESSPEFEKAAMDENKVMDTFRPYQ